MERILAIVAVGLGSLSSVVALVLAFAGKISIPADIWFAYTLAIGTIFMVYVYCVFEENSKLLKAIASTPFDGLEIFTSSSSLLNRIASLTVGARTVSTINLSDTPETFIHLSSYFQTVHKYILEGNDLTSFRRIVGIQHSKKVLWMLKASNSLISTSKLSAAFADMRNGSVIDMCFHIVERDDGHFTFIFPSVDLTGKMPAILINNKLVASAMTIYFDGMWHKLHHFHDGKKLHQDAFVTFENWFPDIINDYEYTTIKQELIDASH